MTMKASALIVGGDKALDDWLRDRFGIDVDKVLITEGLAMHVSRNDALTMTVKFFVGSDDLAAFPQTEVAQ